MSEKNRFKLCRPRLAAVPTYVAAYDSVIRIFREIEADVLQWHGTIGMFVHTSTMLLNLNFRRHDFACALTANLQLK